MNSTSYLSDLLIQGIGSTLIHTLWQGMIIALLLNVVLYAVPRKNAELKYWLSVTALCTLVFWGGYTLNQQLVPLMDKFAISTGEVIGISQGISEVQLYSLYSIPYVKSLVNQMIEILQPFMPSLVVAWFIGVVFLLIRLQGSMIYLRRLKNLGTQPLPLVWKRKVEELSQKLGIRKSVKILQSKLAEVPMVIGHLKPVVLLPLGMLTGLQTHEVEAILAHELAHIRRYDYAINIVQTVVESLLFFNPAVWWISHTIRKHREHCCDDIAVKYCGNQLEYVNALSNLGTWSLRTPALGMGLFKNKNELLMRIKRLVYPQVGVRTIKEKLVPGTVLLLSVICLTWYSHRVQAQWMPLQHQDHSSLVTAALQLNQKTDTIPAAPAPANIDIEEELPSMLPPLGELPLMPPPLDFEEEVEMDIDIDSTPDIDIEIADFEIFKDFEISLPDMEDLTALSQIEMPNVFMEMDELVDMDQIKIIIKDLNLQLDDTTRERIREALEEQREVLEQAKAEQSEALEKAREQLRKSLEDDRPEELTDEEWEMAKNQIRQAERWLERAMQQSERALEQALGDREHKMQRPLDRVIRDMDQQIIHKHIERFEHDQERFQLDQARMLREMARAHRYGDRGDFRLKGKHAGKESHLRHTLLQDGLIDEYDSDISLVFKKDLIKINGNKLEGSQKEKYRELLDDIYGENSSGSIEYRN